MEPLQKQRKRKRKQRFSIPSWATFNAFREKNNSGLVEALDPNGVVPRLTERQQMAMLKRQLGGDLLTLDLPATVTSSSEALISPEHESVRNKRARHSFPASYPLSFVQHPQNMEAVHSDALQRSFTDVRPDKESAGIQRPTESVVSVQEHNMAEEMSRSPKLEFITDIETFKSPSLQLKPLFKPPSMQDWVAAPSESNAHLFHSKLFELAESASKMPRQAVDPPNVESAIEPTLEPHEEAVNHEEDKDNYPIPTCKQNREHLRILYIQEIKRLKSENEKQWWLCDKKASNYYRFLIQKSSHYQPIERVSIHLTKEEKIMLVPAVDLFEQEIHLYKKRIQKDSGPHDDDTQNDVLQSFIKNSISAFELSELELHVDSIRILDAFLGNLRSLLNSPVVIERPTLDKIAMVSKRKSETKEQLDKRTHAHALKIMKYLLDKCVENWTAYSADYLETKHVEWSLKWKIWESKLILFIRQLFQDAGFVENIVGEQHYYKPRNSTLAAPAELASLVKSHDEFGLYISPSSINVNKDLPLTFSLTCFGDILN